MRECVGEKLGGKVAGGIRTAAEFEGMLDAGATRMGVSAGVARIGG